MVETFEYFTKEITSIYRSIQRIKEFEMGKFGLKGIHVTCLYFLYRYPQGLTSAKLTQLTGEDKGAISRAISLLKDKNFVKQDIKQGKNYRANIILTESGIQIAKAQSEKIDSAVLAVTDGLSCQDRQVFKSVLSQLQDNLKAYEKNLIE